MFHTTPETRTARKPHQCTWCAFTIPVGEKYVAWVTFEDGLAGPNKMHEDCYEVASADGPFEYCPYENERPTNDRASKP